MASVAWTKQEIKAVVATLKHHYNIREAVQEHNKKWKTQRSSDGVRDALDRFGAGNAGDYLRIDKLDTAGIEKPKVSQATLKKWGSEEIRSLTSCLKRHSDSQAALREHNEKWKTGRTLDSITDVLRNNALGTLKEYLKPAPGLSIKRADLPEEKRIKALVDLCKTRPNSTLTDLCNSLELPPKSLLELVRKAIDRNYKLHIAGGERVTVETGAPPVNRLAVHRLPIDPVNDYITVGVASDIHFGSRLHRGECLVDFINTC